MRSNTSSAMPSSSAATAARPKSSDCCSAVAPSPGKRASAGSATSSSSTRAALWASAITRALDLHAGGFARHGEDRHAVVGPRRHQQQRRNMAVGHEASSCPIASSRRLGISAQRDGLRPVLRPFVHRQRGDGLAAGDAWQPGACCSGTAGQLQQPRGDHAAAQEGQGAQVAADLLHQHADLHRAQAGAAMRLGHGHAGKAQLGKGRPGGAGKAGRVLAVAQLAQLGHRRVIAQESACAVAQHRLFFVQQQAIVKPPAVRECVWQ